MSIPRNAADRLRTHARWLFNAALTVPIWGCALMVALGSRGHRTVRRSLWCGAPIITLGVLAKAERLLGVHAQSLVYQTYHLSSDFDVNLSRWMRWPLSWCLPYLVFAWALVRYQRFHFFYDRGLLPQVQRGQFNRSELRILKLLRKEMFFYAYGADVRTRAATEALGEPNLCRECPAPTRHCICDDARGRENYQAISRVATACFSMGDMTAYTPGSFNELFYWPLDLEADQGRRYRPHYPDVSTLRTLRIVHAANHRYFKGTEYLIRACDSLRQRGYSLELRLVERLSNGEALEIYRTADIVFDQCLAGFHGYFALEAMAMGKPVMTFVRRPENFLLAASESPLINTRPETLENDLKQILSQPEQLTRIGEQGRRYIQRHYSLSAFAARLDRALRAARSGDLSESPESNSPRRVDPAHSLPAVAARDHVSLDQDLPATREV